MGKNISTEIENCSICLTEVSNCITNCNHIFCYKCINKWNNTKEKIFCHYCKNEDLEIYKIKS